MSGDPDKPASLVSPPAAPTSSLATPEVATDDALREQLRNTDTEHPDRALIMLDFARIFCGRHGEPFRAQWPKGAIIFQIEGVQQWLSTPEVAIEIEKLGLSFEKGVEHLLASVPLCCRLSDRSVADLLALYVRSGVGVVARCAVCREKKLGAPYKLRMNGQTTTLPHACFSCVCTRMVAAHE